MVMRWATFFVLVFAAAVGRSVAQVPDSVKLANANGSEQNGVIAWGRPAMLQGVGLSPVPIGILSRGEANQAVAFTIGRPPALDSDVAWTGTNDIIPLIYPTPYKIPIKIWVLCVDDDCQSPVPAWKTADLDGFLVWANGVLLAERVGITLDASGGLIADKTGMTGSASNLFWDFDTAANCGKLEAAAASLGMKTNGAFNLYLVRTVDGLYGKGDFCYTHDSAVLGSQAAWGTMLHEMGHDLGLWHVDGKPWFSKVGGKKNLMCASSATRKYVTEGQVFRMHFTSGSGLNFQLSSSLPPSLPPGLSQQRTPRNCDASTPASLPCPPEETMLWKDR
jgi:hypothetical protein